MNIDFFDNKEFEHAELTVTVSGAPLTKLRGLSGQVDADKETLFAAGRNGISIQTGNKTITGSLKMLFGALMDLWTASVAAGGDDPTDIEVDIIGKVVRRTNRKQYLITFEGVQFNTAGFSEDQGDKFVEVELPFVALRFRMVQA